MTMGTSAGNRRSVGRIVVAGILRGYQLLLSPIYGPVCRYAPSCSHYAHDAVLMHGPVYGGWLALRRLARCHPWGGSGFDPVPPHGRSASGRRAAGSTQNADARATRTTGNGHG